MLVKLREKIFVKKRVAKELTKSGQERLMGFFRDVLEGTSGRDKQAAKQFAGFLNSKKAGVLPENLILNDGRTVAVSDLMSNAKSGNLLNFVQSFKGDAKKATAEALPSAMKYTPQQIETAAKKEQKSIVNQIKKEARKETGSSVTTQEIKDALKNNQQFGEVPKMVEERLTNSTKKAAEKHAMTQASRSEVKERHLRAESNPNNPKNMSPEQLRDFVKNQMLSIRGKNQAASTNGRKSLRYTAKNIRGLKQLPKEEVEKITKEVWAETSPNAVVAPSVKVGSNGKIIGVRVKDKTGQARKAAKEAERRAEEERVKNAVTVYKPSPSAPPATVAPVTPANTTAAGTTETKSKSKIPWGWIAGGTLAGTGGVVGYQHYKNKKK